MKANLDTLEPPFREGGIAYSDEQNRTWATICARLQPLHAAHACTPYLDGRRALAMPTTRIPQLHDLSRDLERIGGFVVRPIAGLVDARLFLTSLGRRVMLSTTYIRDGGDPEYAPEPDIVHEVLGHVPMLIDPEMQALLDLFGRAAEAANDRQMRLLESLYWFTIEFGLVEEAGAPKAWGAGVLSSIGEMRHAMTAAEHRPFNAAEAAHTASDHTVLQDLLFIAPSVAAVRADVASYLQSEAYLRA